VKRSWVNQAWLPALAALALAASARAAQDTADAQRGAEVVVAPEAQQPKEDAGEGKPAKPPTETVDPDVTKMSQRLKDAYKEDKPAAVQAPPPPPKIPDLAVRGLIKAGDKAAMAIIAIDGKRLITVQSNSQVSIKTTEGRVLTLKFTLVSPDGVELEIPELKEKLSLR
jgi:hypothetical protein